VRSQLESLAGAGVERVLLAVNCELHRGMLPLLAATSH
jgi:hypothetical protein